MWSGEIHDSANKHVSGSPVIIDDVLIHSTSLRLCPILLEYYMLIYFKYREYFKRGKFEFLSEYFEFGGRDIMPTGNTTAASKCDFITDWEFPVTSVVLHLFVFLINFIKDLVLY